MSTRGWERMHLNALPAQPSPQPSRTSTSTGKPLPLPHRMGASVSAITRWRTSSEGKMACPSPCAHHTPIWAPPMPCSMMAGEPSSMRTWGVGVGVGGVGCVRAGREQVRDINQSQGRERTYHGKLPS